MKEKILVLAKTYPNLSQKYVETVCCAGINEKNEWRRLYPIPFRQLPKSQQFKKFHWIEADLEKNDKEMLKRKESHKVNTETIKVLNWVNTDNNWGDRNKLLMPIVNKSLEELEEQKTNHTSLGIIKPKEVSDFILTPLADCRDWEKDLIEGTQKTLFGEYKTPLDKIPWKFSYIFKCDDSRCKGHNIMCEDWELLESWRSWQNKYPDNKTLKEKKTGYFILLSI